MYVELSERHHTPHFHAYYGDEVGVFSIRPISLLAGTLGLRHQRLVEAWAELHQDELAADWDRLQNGQRATPIPPLQ